MNEKNQYMEMLEIPFNTCNLIVEKPKKLFKRRKKKLDHEKVKETLVEKVNSGEELALEDEKSLENCLCLEDLSDQNLTKENTDDIIASESQIDSQLEQSDLIDTAVVSVSKKEKKKRFGFSMVKVQLSIICALILTIFLTNAVYSESGINVFLRSVFGSGNSQVVDAREFSDFTPVLNLEDGAAITVSNGVMTISGTGSVYPSVNGKVSSVIQGDDGLYSIEITHTSSFKSLITGLDYAYVGLDDSVYSNIPVGFCREGGVSLCFLGADGSVISDYQIVDNSVVWAV